MKKILITGSEGFVGKNLIRYLKNYSFQIIETKDKSFDLKFNESWKQIEKCDYLIHFYSNLKNLLFQPKWKFDGKLHVKSISIQILNGPYGPYEHILQDRSSNY